MKNIYKIDNLVCCYKDKETKRLIEVLDVENVSIARGEITIILGPSGSGKSTFMEAISLMSDTINAKKSENIYFFPEECEGEPVNLLTFKEQTRELQKLRFDNFSFIFQDTNIMGNFDPRENVALPKMVYSPEGAIEEANRILRDNLNLKLPLDKKAFEYSGGQKQRFAFARAFMAKGSVLFGDEPTGNLDKYNSEKLFWVLKQHITDACETKNSINKTGAIVVTHSIELALQFADRIIVIVKPEKYEDISEEENNDRDIIKGYVNPFFVYNNNNDGKWREDRKGKNLEKSDLLPPIDDDGSNRFSYRELESNENGKLVKDKLKKEIIFFLNNSYAFAQEILVEFAKELNVLLQALEKQKETNNKQEIEENQKVLFEFFDRLKTKIISIIEEMTKDDNKITFNEFESILLSLLKVEFETESLFQEIIIKVEPALLSWLKKFANGNNKK